jgi:hypothetical protein
MILTGGQLTGGLAVKITTTEIVCEADSFSKQKHSFSHKNGTVKREKTPTCFWSSVRNSFSACETPAVGEGCGRTHCQVQGSACSSGSLVAPTPLLSLQF